MPWGYDILMLMFNDIFRKGVLYVEKNCKNCGYLFYNYLCGAACNRRNGIFSAEAIPYRFGR